MIRQAALVAIVSIIGASTCLGQTIIIEPPVIPPPYPRPPIPRPRPWPIDYALEVKSQKYATEITDGVAVTRVDQTFHNPYPQPIEGTYVFPLTADASVSGFSMFVDGREIKGELLDREQARRVYQDIVSRRRDPALLEYVGSRLYQARIFPIPPKGDVRVKLQYSQTLAIDAGMATLILPLKADARTTQPAASTSVVVNIRSQTAIKNVFSPSHAVSVHQPADREASVSYETSGMRSEEDFVVHYTLSDEAFGLAWLTYREAADDGYFMARIAPPANIDSDRVLPKDVAFVFDTSGSMAGAKIAQARDALKFCLNRLNRADRFAVIPFSHDARPFREQLIPATAENVEEAVRLCQSAGITPVMITGDHPATARAIATRLGIIDEGAEVLTGRELARLDMAEFERHVERVRVYARVAPEQKIKIVQALQDKGEFAAMTGDGVNDAPALRRADIGVAMGVTGTDVAKEAAHMVLLDDNFATIVGAVREGRRIFDNIRKFIKYTMTSNSGEIWTIFLAPFLGLPIPLLPIHILWINLVTDGLPGLALALEPEEKGVMKRPPRPPAESIFAHGMWQHMIWVGLLMGAASLLTQAWSIHVGSAHWQTMVFTVLTLSQLGHVLAIRSERESLFRQGLWSNPSLIGAVLLTFGLQLATIYVPWLNPIFKTEPLDAGELVFCLAMSSVVFFAVEIEKWLVRRGVLYTTSARAV